MTKITIDRATVEQALEALENLTAQCAVHPRAFQDWSKGRAAIAGMGAALEQPELEPAHGDIRALKYLIHELEGEVIGYKRMLEEAALKKLADLGQEIEQEPVGEVLNERGESDYISYAATVGTRLYTTPPAAQRKPLTDAEIRSIHDTYYRRMGPQEFARAIEAAHGIKEET